jgi:transposase-like protein
VDCGRFTWIAAKQRCFRCHRRLNGVVPRRVVTVWTPERQARLDELYETGMTITKIAAKMGVTKSAISGRLWRQGMRRKAPIYTGPTWGQRLDELHDRMDALIAEQAIARAAGRHYKLFYDYNNEDAA